MKTKYQARVAAFIFLIGGFAVSAHAQWGSPNAYGYNTGYGAVYGTFNHAALMQSMYNVTRSEQLRREQKGKAGSTNHAKAPSQKGAAAVVIRNYGLFRRDASIDTAKLLADTLGSTPEEKQLIRSIFNATKDGFESEAPAAWHNNIAGGLTFFTSSALTVYHQAGEPDDAGANNYFQAVNISLDRVEGFGKVPNQEKQSFQNIMIGFSGMLLAIHTEGKQTGDRETLAAAKQLAGQLIRMVLKADPESMRIENGQIVLR